MKAENGIKVVILAGGLGSRMGGNVEDGLKPLAEIGGQPILWHVMKIYAAYGLNDFVICCGHKGKLIKQYFLNYRLFGNDFTIDLANGEVQFHRNAEETWKVALVDTGAETMTGGRIKRIREHVDGETFCLTYCDGVADIDIDALLAFHRANDAVVTLTAVKPPSQFGNLELRPDDPFVARFREKDEHIGEFVNGGFFVINPEAFDLLEKDETVWEHEPLEVLAQKRRLAAYRHHGFWHNMDTVHDQERLERLWADGNAPWKIW